MSSSEKTQENVLSLKQIDVLIKNTEYDTALLELNRYFEKYPDHFDGVQLRIDKIMKARDLYSVLAKQLLKVIREEPGNTEKLGRLTERLVAMEHNPADSRLDIIKNTNNLVELAKYSLIQNESSALAAKGEYEAAAKKAAEGFFIYKIPFYSEYSQKPVYAEAERRISFLNNLISQFPAVLSELDGAVMAYSRVLSSGNFAELDGALSSVSAGFTSLARIRNDICRTGAFFAAEYAGTGDRKGEEFNQFFKYARDTVFGWQENPDCGITGAIDAAWNVSLEKLKSESVSAVQKSFGTFFSENSMFMQDIDQSVKAESLADVKKISACAVRLDSLNELLLSDDAVKNRTGYKNYRLSLDYAAMLADHTVRAASLLSDVHSVWSGTEDLELSWLDELEKLKTGGFSLAGLQAYNSNSDRTAVALADASGKIESLSARIYAESPESSVWGAEYLDAMKRQDNGMTAVRRRMTAGVDIKDAVLDWRKFIEETVRFSGRCRSISAEKNALIWKKIAALNSVFGETAASYSESELKFMAVLIDGEKTEGDDSLRRYPSLALKKNQELSLVCGTSRKILTDSIVQPGGKFSTSYTSDISSIQNSVVRLDKVISSLKSGEDAANTLLKSYQKSKNEADLRLSQARKALASENFENARKRLQEASEKYVEALSFNNDDAVRKAADADMLALGNEIKEKENVLVVREVRQLKNQARREYFNGNFQAAEKCLNNARARWADTNIEEDAEITSLLAVVDTALSMKTGRVLLPSDSLYPEMSQVLSIAYQYYNQGVSLSKKGKKQEAGSFFDKALQKLEELRLVYPQNQEASLLALRIQQTQNPLEFEQSFSDRIDSVKRDYKDTDSARQRQAYSALLDLYEINPDYPGIKKLLYDVEIEVGVRQKPVQKNDVSRSSELLAEAERLYNSAGRDENRLRQALAKADEAIRLHSGNDNAILLKDEISIRLGGNVSVVLSAEDTAKYNKAVQELQRNNVLVANALVEQLLQKKDNKNSARILELQKRIKARM